MRIAAIRSRFASPIVAAKRATKGVLPFVATTATAAVLYHVSPDFNDFALEIKDFAMRWPKLSISLTSSVFLGYLPDRMAQGIGGKKNSFGRSAINTAAGGLTGLAIFYLYRFYNATYPGNSLLPSTQKAAFDQFAVEPLYLTIYNAVGWKFGKKSERPRNENFWQNTARLAVKNWLIWIPSLLAIFTLVPQELQAFAQNGLAFFWRVFMSRWAFDRPSRN